jgi:hypothetical protein
LGNPQRGSTLPDNPLKLEIAGKNPISIFNPNSAFDSCTIYYFNSLAPTKVRNQFSMC